MFDGAEPMFDGEFKLGDHVISNSGKMVVLDKLLAHMHAAGNKVLVRQHRFCLAFSEISPGFANSLVDFQPNDTNA